MSRCEKCHGTGKVTCSKCGGDTKVKCEKCKGHGELRDCKECNSTGKVDCPSCDGSGEEISICPVCDKGKIKKTRWINCDWCHGKGYYTYEYAPGYHPECGGCHGRGQVEDVYEDICPNCHGEYQRKTGKPCKHCGGSGKKQCARCNGTGHAKCQECGGTGKTKCDKCDGDGSVKCPDCEARDKQVAEIEMQLRDAVSTSDKKRWKFVVLGILLGFFGVHLAYAKRWLLFLLLWAGFITGNVMSDPKKESTNVSAEAVTEQVPSESKLDKDGSNLISNIGFGVWALLWIGGALFIKKDGKGNRM